MNIRVKGNYQRAWAHRIAAFKAGKEVGPLDSTVSGYYYAYMVYG